MKNKALIIYLCAAVTAALAAPVAAQQPSAYWTDTEGLALDDAASDVAVDIEGNIYVTGYRSTGATTSEWFTVSYEPRRDAMGQAVVRWRSTYTGPGVGRHEANALVLDEGTGGLYVTGQSPGAGTGLDYAIIRYSMSTGAADGTNWPNIGFGDGVRRYNGPGNGTDVATALDIDSEGFIYVTGRSEGVGTGLDYATLKYTSDGLLSSSWPNDGVDVQGVRRYNGPGNAYDGAVDLEAPPFASATGECTKLLYVTGTSYGGPTTQNDYATLQYCRENGTRQWVARYNGPGNGFGDNNDVAAGLAIVGAECVVTGSSMGGGGIEGFGGPEGGGGLPDPVGGQDYLTIRYALDTGTPVWTARYDGPAGSAGTDVAFGIDAGSFQIDGIDRVWVVGLSSGIGTGYDAQTIQYNATTGAREWTGSAGRYATTLDDRGYDVRHVRGTASVYVVGWAQNAGGDTDYITLKYDALGAQQWATTYGGVVGGNDSGNHLAIDLGFNEPFENPNERVIVTGAEVINNRGYNLTTIRYIQE